jgi:hypothetical protein
VNVTALSILFDDIRLAGISLRLVKREDGDMLGVAPLSALTPDIRDRLLRLREDVLGVLRQDAEESARKRTN